MTETSDERPAPRPLVRVLATDSLTIYDVDALVLAGRTDQAAANLA